MAQTPLSPELTLLLSDFAEPTELQADTRLKEDLGLDSMEIVQLVMKINRQFALQIQSSEITPDNFATLGRIQALIERKRSGA